MTLFPPRTRRRLAALAFAFLASAASAQMVAPPSDDPAVRLAANMRELGRNPNSVPALIGAGESALAVGDAEAAFNFLSRAQELSPIDGRVKFLLGSVLLQMDRPADGLRLFNEAQILGANANALHRERGLAYDLLGDQKKAQAEYRAFLKSADDDEVVRRLALSMGIAGERDKALELLNPLLRRRDQSAWRARTFILAINGNLKEADQIAAQVMPSDNGESLKPFLRRLAVLSPGQQAMATNFGIMPSGGVPASTSVRTAQADPPQGLIPSQTPLTAKPAPIVAEQSPSWARSGAKDRRSRRDRKAAEQMAAAAPVVPAGPTPPPADALTPNFAIDAQPPASSTRMASASPAVVRPLPSAPNPVLAPNPVAPRLIPTPALPPVGERKAVAETPGMDLAQGPSQAAVGTPLPRATPPVQIAAATPAVFPQAEASVPAVSTTDTQVPAPATATAPETVAATGPVVASGLPSFDLATTKSAVPVTPVVNTPAAAPQMPDVAQTAEMTTVAPASTVVPPPAATPPAATPGFGADEVAASPPIQVAMAETAVPPSSAGQPMPVQGEEAASPSSSLPPSPAEQGAPAAPVVEPTAETAAETGLAAIVAGLKPEEQSAAAPLPGEREIRAARLAARKKAEAEAAAKSVAETKKAEDDRKKTEEAARAKANPSRIWVQIATGSNKAGLAGTVRSVREKAPKAMGGLSGWYAPVRATNRVLVGPIKGATEARALVAALARAGVIANYWTSAAGEDVFRIGK